MLDTMYAETDYYTSGITYTKNVLVNKSWKREWIDCIGKERI